MAPTASHSSCAASTPNQDPARRDQRECQDPWLGRVVIGPARGPVLDEGYEGGQAYPGGIEGGAYPGGQLDGTGRVTVQAQRLDRAGDDRTVLSGYLTRGREPERPSYHCLHIGQDSPGLAAWDQFPIRQVGSVGVPLGNHPDTGIGGTCGQCG